ncbi:MAG: anthranilate synthase, component I [Acidobacteria bacterium OLB17]|nr:MAG: anthranilate synthase, component I [Acidobacteria bacterium OLB17]MCZ2389541.1 anthranilate synthase component I family protein [Acidobacteriota bacterium]
MNASPQQINLLRPVVETIPADLLTPLAVYLKLTSTSDHSFLLESVEGGENLARYSFIGADPIQVIGGGSETFGQLRRIFADSIAAADTDLPPFIGGAIGCIGFDACEWFEPSLANGEAKTVASLMVFRSVVAFDHAQQKIKIVTVAPENETGTAQCRNAEIRSLLESDKTVSLARSAKSGSRQGVSNQTRDEFEGAVEKIKEYIKAGDCYQAVYSQRFTRETDASPIAIYRALRSLNPSPYMFLMQIGTRSVIGASPEMLVRCVDGKLEYRPIAGTRHRGATTDEDERLADEMKADAKEVSEHLMLVDLGRNDLGRVSEFGSVKVDTLMAVERYSHVQHLVSSLSSKLSPGKDMFDAFAACFPAGTVSGAPKVRAIEIIRELEPTPRGIYAGAIGYFDYRGNMDTCISIRTLVLENGVATIQAGAGIVADSNAASEFEETINKAKGLMRAIDLAETGELG